MAAPQLERSMLERKERDELSQIADALQLNPGPRAKKADLITAILQATGAEVAPPEDVAEVAKPKVRTRKKAAPVQDALPVEVPDESAIDGTGTAEVPPAGAEVDAAAVPVTVEVAPGDDDPADDDEADDEAPVAGRAAPAPPAHQPQARPLPPRPPAQQQPQNQQPQNQQPQNQQPQNQQPQGPAIDGEEGGSRRRRRRGRDRAALGPGYEQQAAQGDQTFTGEATSVAGLLDIRPEGFGFLRAHGHLPSQDDVYVSMSQLRRFGLRAGDRIEGGSRPASSQEKFPALVRIDTVAGLSPDEAQDRRRFEDLEVHHPQIRLGLGDGVLGKAIDLLAPIGKGQRTLVVAPPRSGKTTVVKDLALAIEAAHPQLDLVVVLLDEHPEEIADMSRALQGDVVGTTFDRAADEHVHVAELAIEVAKRRVEAGGEVVVLIDSLTRLARANLAVAPVGGRSGAGVDQAAILPVKRLLAAAREISGDGSLTLVGTLQVGSGSTLDAAIAEELIGTATSELHLDARLAEDRSYPAISVAPTGTRHEELLLGDDLERSRTLRKELVALEREGRADEAHARLLAALS